MNENAQHSKSTLGTPIRKGSVGRTSHCKSPAISSDLLSFVQSAVASCLRQGDMAVDATAGNGHDTLFLSRQVGADGLVLGFDVQEDALRSTRKRLVQSKAAENVRLIHQGHEHLAEHLESLRSIGLAARPLRAVMFNLGYLPGSDKTLVTRPETSVPALDQALQALDRGGICSVMLYTGHAGGMAEAQAIMRQAATLDFKTFRCLRSEFCNKPGSPIVSLLIHKR